MHIEKKRNARVLLPLLVFLGVILLAGAAVGTALYLNRGHTAVALIRVIFTEGGDIDSYKAFKNAQLESLKKADVHMAALRKEGIADLEILRQMDDPLGWLESDLKAGYDNDSELMRLSLTARNPEEVRILLDAIVNAYFEEVVDKQELSEKIEELKQIHDSKEEEVHAKQEALRELARTLNTSDAEAIKIVVNTNNKELTSLRSAQRRMQADLSKADRALQDENAKLEIPYEKLVSKAELDKLVREDPICRHHSKMLANLEKAVEDQQQRYRQNQKNDPNAKKVTTQDFTKELKSLKEELDIRTKELREILENSKRAEYKETIAAAEVQVKILSNQLKGLSQQVERKREIVAKIIQSSKTFNKLSSEIDKQEKSLQETSDEITKLENEQKTQPRVVIERAAYLEQR